MRRWLVPLALLLLTTAGCAPLPQPAPDVQVSETRSAEVTAQRRGSALLIGVRSPTGIGGASVALPADAAGDDLILRLHLRGLENFTFAYNAGVVQVSVPSSGAAVARETFTPAGGAATPIALGSPFWMEVSLLSSDPAITPAVPLEAGYFDLLAPLDFVRSRATAFHIEWIDFYR